MIKVVADSNNKVEKKVHTRDLKKYMEKEHPSV